jgi:hypothetical protein
MDATKAFSRAGGFKGTAIKPYWIIMKATEVFGPVGIGWGWEEIENKYIAGVWCSKVRLWYKNPYYTPPPAQPSTFGALTGFDFRGVIEQWGQTVMETTRTNKDTGVVSTFVDEEAPKKAVTDAVTKCLSYLGFGGDVHMGRFDDSKYVAERKKEETAKARNERFLEVKAALSQSDDPAATWHDFASDIAEFKRDDQQFYDDLVQAAKERKHKLAEMDKIIAGYGKGFNDALKEGGYQDEETVED